MQESPEMDEVMRLFMQDRRQREQEIHEQIEVLCNLVDARTHRPEEAPRRELTRSCRDWQRGMISRRTSQFLKQWRQHTRYLTTSGHSSLHWCWRGKTTSLHSAAVQWCGCLLREQQKELKSFNCGEREHVAVSCVPLKPSVVKPEWIKVDSRF